MTQLDELVRLANAGRAAEKRKKWWTRFWSAVLLQILGAFAGGWFLMLGVGVLHNDWWPEFPPMGYWTAVLTVALLRGVFSRLELAKEKSNA